MHRIVLRALNERTHIWAGAGLSLLLGTALLTVVISALIGITELGVRSTTNHFARADYVVTAPPGTPLTQDVVSKIQKISGVDAALGVVEKAETYNLADDQVSYPLVTSSIDPRLNLVEVVQGRAPRDQSEVALPIAARETYRVRIGDRVLAHPEARFNPVARMLVVTGFTEDTFGNYVGTHGAALRAQYPQQTGSTVPPDLEFSHILVAGNPSRSTGADPNQLENRIRSELASDLGIDVRPQSVASIHHDLMDRSLTTALVPKISILSVSLLSLGACALAVCGSFSSIVRSLHSRFTYLRTYGASRRNIRRAVVVQAVFVGLVSCILGVICGNILVEFILDAASGSRYRFVLPDSAYLIPATTLIPVAVGTLISVIAAYRASKRIPESAPLTTVSLAGSLNSADSTPQPTQPRTKLLDYVLGTFVILAVALLGAFVVRAEELDNRGIIAAVGCSALLLFVVCFRANWWVPALFGLAQRRLQPHQVRSQLVIHNLKAASSRSATMLISVFLAVSLISLFAVASASVRSSMIEHLTQKFGFDLSITAHDSEGFTDDDLTWISSVPGVASAASTVVINGAAAYLDEALQSDSTEGSANALEWTAASAPEDDSGAFGSDTGAFGSDTGAFGSDSSAVSGASSDPGFAADAVAGSVAGWGWMDNPSHRPQETTNGIDSIPVFVNTPELADAVTAGSEEPQVQPEMSLVGARYLSGLNADFSAVSGTTSITLVPVSEDDSDQMPSPPSDLTGWPRRMQVEALPSAWAPGILLADSDWQRLSQSIGVDELSISATVFVRFDDISHARVPLEQIEKYLMSRDVTYSGAVHERLASEHALTIAEYVVAGLVIITALVVTIGLAHSAFASAFDRRLENQILRTLGLSRRDAALMAAAESLGLVLLGTILGVLAGVVLGSAGFVLVGSRFGLGNVSVPLPHLLLVVLVAAFLSLSAAVGPAWLSYTDRVLPQRSHLTRV